METAEAFEPGLNTNKGRGRYGHKGPVDDRGRPIKVDKDYFGSVDEGWGPRKSWTYVCPPGHSFEDAMSEDYFVGANLPLLEVGDVIEVVWAA